MNLGGFRHNFISVNVSVNWICFYYTLCAYELPAAALRAVVLSARSVRSHLLSFELCSGDSPASSAHQSTVLRIFPRDLLPWSNGLLRGARSEESMASLYKSSSVRLFRVYSLIGATLPSFLDWSLRF
jgi:hypothetical protein